MVRTVVYPPLRPSSSPTRDVRQASEAGGKQTSTEMPDEYGDKLMKYIPAEVIAFFMPAFALALKLTDYSETIGWLLVGAGVLGTVGYLLLRTDKDKPPRWYFYILAVLAFLGWAVGTTAEVGTLFNLSQPDLSGKLILLVIVFLVPLVDELLTRYLPPPADS